MVHQLTASVFVVQKVPQNVSGSSVVQDALQFCMRRLYYAEKDSVVLMASQMCRKCQFFQYCEVLVENRRPFPSSFFDYPTNQRNILEGHKINKDRVALQMFRGTGKKRYLVFLFPVCSANYRELQGSQVKEFYIISGFMFRYGKLQ